ncbi:hypothetical protein [Streptomyces goshikiensis]|uniref:hypothetical protein n=1 Tax=Streptomyces goshikiensis TaxID=1942 RepID=UPI0036AAB25A
MRERLHCPPRSPRPVLAHSLLTYRQVPPPPLPEHLPSFTANETEQLLLKAIAEHSTVNGIARAALILPADVKARTEELVRAAGATDATHLVGLGHALRILGHDGQGAPHRAELKGAAR